jgi:ergothioneine biosynthesis protein EgtB
MHAPSVTAFAAPRRAPDLTGRQGDARALAAALQDSRRDTLATFAAYEQALPDLQVPQAAHLNPPLWELGHVGWFQNHWLARQPPAQRWRGSRADPFAPRLDRAPGHRAGDDALYDSSRVAHALRWGLPLPGAQATRDQLAEGLAATLALLQAVDDLGLAGEAAAQALYFFRLALLHEDMHHEAALYMAQDLGVPVPDVRWRAQPLPLPPPPLRLSPEVWHVRTLPITLGFAFDNECGALAVAQEAFEIDAQVLRWAEFLPFVEAGGYEQPRWWSPQGWAWRQGRPGVPRHLRREPGPGPQWWAWRKGAWAPLDLAEPACHLTAHEAQAWCAWAGRRLPTEWEWERAALTQPAAFAWGEVWEWTASAFAPLPGFEPHPYRDYSAPWFDGRPVLRGASFMTQPRMRHPRYRNFFEAHRSDVPAGFRTCAVTPVQG